MLSDMFVVMLTIIGAHGDYCKSDLCAASYRPSPQVYPAVERSRLPFEIAACWGD